MEEESTSSVVPTLETPKESSGKSNRPKEKSRPQFDKKDYTLKKRLPARLPKRHNDIYITNKTNFAAQLQRCCQLFANGEREVYLHGLGAAIQRTLNLALAVKKKHLGTVEIAINTSTVDLTDDLEPIRDQVLPTVQNRRNSAVHVKLFRTALVIGGSNKEN